MIVLFIQNLSIFKVLQGKSEILQNPFVCRVFSPRSEQQVEQGNLGFPIQSLDPMRKQRRNLALLPCHPDKPSDIPPLPENIRKLNKKIVSKTINLNRTPKFHSVNDACGINETTWVWKESHYSSEKSVTDVNLIHLKRKWNASNRPVRFFLTTVLRVSYIKKTSAFEFIQSWIEETKRRKAFQEALVINERENSSDHWSWGLEQTALIVTQFLWLFNLGYSYIIGRKARGITHTLEQQIQIKCFS